MTVKAFFKFSLRVLVRGDNTKVNNLAQHVNGYRRLKSNFGIYTNSSLVEPFC